MSKKNIVLFVVIPFTMNLLFLALYFSGWSFAQQMIAPKLEGFAAGSWREFGLVEQLQNVLLLVSIIVLLLCVKRKELAIEKVSFFIGAALFIFLLAEEMDYGLHYYEMITGEPSTLENRNWHNQTSDDGTQNVKSFKQAADAVGFIWFILLPIFSRKITLEPLRKIIPSAWFIAGFLIAILSSRAAHYLQGLGLDVIDGAQGQLRGNVSEFRETSTYYFYMLYSLQLLRTNIFNKHQDQVPSSNYN